jgi:TonB-dependent starch-binding outer membrane protein SusC
MKYSYINLLGIKNFKHYLFGMVLTFVAMIAHAQNPTVTGTITDADTGESLPGTTILEKGTSNGTVTDIDGNYQIVIKEGATLVVSFVGYVSQEIEVGSQNTVNVALDLDVSNLNEVVVIGYGVQRKVDLTGSVAIVDSEEMKKISNSNMSTMLQGKIAGVQVTTDGQPGADPIVRIRGMGTFLSTNPLYVIDGVIMGTTVRDFSPNDIESMQVLKDASAASIYGSRAANGVVIITTKSGKKNQAMKIDYSGYTGFDKVQEGVYDVMDATQYGQYVTMAYQNSDINVPAGYDPTSSKYLDPKKVNTNWFDEAFKTGVRQNHNINLSGGGANSTYNVALDYYSQNGTMVGAGPNFDRYTARIKNTMEAKFIKFTTNIVFSHSDQDNMALSNANEYVQGLYGAQYPVMASVSLLPPSIKAYDQSTWVLDDKISAASGYSYDSYGYGTYYDDVHGDLRVTNVLLTNSLLKRHSTVDRIVASGSANVDLLDMVGKKSSDHKLNYNLNLSYNKTYVRDLTFVPAFIQSTTNYLTKSNETLSQGYRNYSTSLVENTVNYDGKFGKNHINAVAGMSFQQDLSHTLTGRGVNVNEPYFLQVSNAQTTYGASDESEHYLLSYFGRILYDFDEKYLLTATLRRDASSNFPQNDHWGLFPSVSAGWRIDRESFFPVNTSTINLFKLRGSYGILGNENIGLYQYSSTMARGDYSYSFGNNKVTGSSISNFVNQAIKWEKRKTLDIGLDLGLFSNQLEFTFDYYKATSEDLLFDVAVPLNAGATNATVVMNAATMVNSGFEFLLAYHNDDHAVKFDISANANTVNNKVTSLGVSNEPRTDGISRTEVGHQVGQFYGYVYEGIFQSQEQIDNRVNSAGNPVNQNGAQPGDVAYADLNNDGEITNADQKFLGSGIAKVNFGLNVRAEWKGIDLSIFTFGATGFKAVDFVDMTLHSSYGALNKSVDLLDAWTPTNMNTDVPRVAYKSSGSITNDMFSQRFIHDATYLKLANIQLGYNFPDEWLGGYIKSLRVYATAQNVVRFTKYNTYNPDFAGGSFTPGYNYSSYPTPRTMMFGGSFSF